MCHLFKNLKQKQVTIFVCQFPLSSGKIIEKNKAIETFDATNIDTNQVTSMQDLFYLCNKIQTLDVSGWDVSKVKYFILVFGSMTSLKTLKGIESWNTQSATDMQSMFFMDSNLSVDLSSWNVSKVTQHSTFNYYTNKVIAPKCP